MKRHTGYLILIASLALGATGCKPTEQNYQAAYIKAQEKIKADAMDDDPELISTDRPRAQYLQGDTVYVKMEALRGADGSHVAIGYGVAVALYKMPTNAKSNAEALKAKGWKEAGAYKSIGDQWYVMVGHYAKLDEAIEAQKRFKKQFPGYPYIGLHGAPTILNSY